MSEVHAKGKHWRDEWRLVPEVPRGACWLGRCPLCLDPKERDSWRKSAFELWPRGGAAGQLLGAAPV